MAKRPRKPRSRPKAAVQRELFVDKPFTVNGLTLGLDLSLTGTGIVLLDQRGTVVQKTQVGYDLKRTARTETKIERLIYICEQIVTIIQAIYSEHPGMARPVTVAIENYAYSQVGAQSDLGELHGAIKTQLWLAFKLTPRIIGSSTARKLVFGKGNLKKKLVIPTLQERGFNFGTDDIADAYVIAQAARIQTAQRVADGKGADDDGTGDDEWS